MGKAEFGTPKYVAKQMKARGLQRLRWYCQVCSKQCRDENGFKCHLDSPSHIAKAKDAKDLNKVVEYSRMFKHDFVYLLRVSHGEKPINANKFYNEYIQDKDHVHMTATRWTHLTQFIRVLAREGIVSLNETPSDGPEITWINPHKKEDLQEEEDRRAEKETQLPQQQKKILQRQLEATKSVPSTPTLTAPEPTQSETKVSSSSFSLKRSKPNAKRATPLKRL